MPKCVEGPAEVIEEEPAGIGGVAGAGYELGISYRYADEEQAIAAATPPNLKAAYRASTRPPCDATVPSQSALLFGEGIVWGRRGVVGLMKT